MYKSKLQEFCQSHHWGLPEYNTNRKGPDHMPSFTATLSLRGMFFETPSSCSSSKVAQNTVAKLAFDHFYPNDPPPTATADSDHVPAVSPPPETAAVAQHSPPLPSETSHMYNKNRLYQYAQKHNFGLPEYTCEVKGPPHARRFKSRVSLNGKSYETLEFFSTLKEAEQAASKIACQVLSVDGVQEDGGLYKNLLQEFGHKKGIMFPSYETTRSDWSHNPVFVATVQIGDYTFQGTVAKTKKQAEMNAAKVAYCTLTESCQLTEPLPSSGATENLTTQAQPMASPKKNPDGLDEEEQNPAKKAKTLPENGNMDASLPAPRQEEDHSHALRELDVLRNLCNEVLPVSDDKFVPAAEETAP